MDTSSTLVVTGAAYAAVQAVAYVLSLVVPAHTVVGRISRWLVRWPIQLVPSGQAPRD